MVKRKEWHMRLGGDGGFLERLAVMLNRAAKGSQHGAGAMEWELSSDDGLMRFQFPIGPGQSARRKCCEQVGRVLAEFTLSEYEPRLLLHLMKAKSNLEEGVELDTLVAEAAALLDGEAQPDAGWSKLGRERRLSKLTRRYAEYLYRHERLHMDGFIRFRLGDYHAEVLEAVDNAVEERLLDRQYDVFMDLLKSMAQWQQTGIPTVHVLHAGGHTFRLLDEDMRPLERSDGRIEGGEGEEEEESLIVSRLLAVSPGQLFIHTPEPDSQVIRTLIGIFGDRAALCPHFP